jgi:syntaxin 18
MAEELVLNKTKRLLKRCKPHVVVTPFHVLHHPCPKKMAINRTAEFRKAVDEKRIGTAEPKRKRVSKNPAADGKDIFDKEYLKEGYAVVRSSLCSTFVHLLKAIQLNHIITLTRMLAHIRKPYLNVDSRPAQFSRKDNTRTLDLSNTDESWSSIRYLTNEERDQLDIQARVILTSCSDRVKEMEALEKRALFFTLSSHKGT